MGQKFEKEGFEAEYDVKFTFDTTDKTLTEDAKKIVEKLKDAKEWSFVGVANAKKNGIDRIREYAAPKKFNGHQETEGWGWQADVETMGAGSKARLLLACKPGDIKIESQKENGMSGKLKKITVKLDVKGKFRLLANSKARVAEK